VFAKHGLQRIGIALCCCEKIPEDMKVYSGDRFDAASVDTKTTALSDSDPEDSRRKHVQELPYRSAGSCSSPGAMAREVRLRLCGPICRQSYPTHSQFHPDHWSTGRCTRDQHEPETAETIRFTDCP
jgi:hypothetical protein